VSLGPMGHSGGTLCRAHFLADPDGLRPPGSWIPPSRTRRPRVDGAGRAQRIRLRRLRPRLRQAGGRGSTGHCRCPGGRTMRGRGEAAAVEGDPAGSEEHGVRNRHVVLGTDVVRSGLPLDMEGAARSRLPRAGRPGLHRHRDRRLYCPSDCSQVRWFLRSTQAVAAAGQEPWAPGLGVGVPGAVASGVVRVSGDGAPIAAARAVACGQVRLRHPGRRVLLGVVPALPPGCRGNRHDQEGQNASQPIISGRHGTNLYKRTRNRRSARRRGSRN
jgi:hypothetical protein